MKGGFRKMEIKSKRLCIDVTEEKVIDFYSINIYPNADNADFDTIEKVLEDTIPPLEELNKKFTDIMDDKSMYKSFVVDLCMAVDESTSIEAIAPFSYGVPFDFTQHRESLTNICFFKEDLFNCFMEYRLLALDYRYNGQITPLTLISYEAMALVRKSIKWDEYWPK